jgi:hypothetical protein
MSLMGHEQLRHFGAGESEPKGSFDVVGKGFSDFADKLGV